MTTPHSLHQDFPDDADRIHALKMSNAHFAKLLRDYDAINDEVHVAETHVKPTSEDHEHDLKRRRAHLKDEIARMLAQHPA